MDGDFALHRVLVFVPTYRRPMQLHACLESLASHLGRSIPHLDIVVVYRGCDEEYNKVRREVQPLFPKSTKITLRPERVFFDDVVGMVANSYYRYVLLCVDDTIFVRELPLVDACRILDSRPDVLTVSLRLSRETNRCYMSGGTRQSWHKLSERQESPDGRIFSYHWTESPHDYGYPMDVSSSIYRQSDLLHIIQTLSVEYSKFSKPTTMESWMATWCKGTGKDWCLKRPRIACADMSSAFSAPLNVVQTETENAHGSMYTSEDLLRRYRNGERIRVELFKDRVTKAVHEEVELKFRKTW